MPAPELSKPLPNIPGSRISELEALLDYSEG